MAYVVTLVHGTFAQNDSWTMPESKLCQHLRHSLTEPIVFQRFCWSGKNSSRARAKAASDLSDLLIATNEKYPEYRHFVIAHSHGGNIATHAASNCDADVAGIVCLSTPFIVVRERWALVSGKLVPKVDSMELALDMLLPKGPAPDTVPSRTLERVYSELVGGGLLALFFIPYYIFTIAFNVTLHLGDLTNFLFSIRWFVILLYSPPIIAALIVANAWCSLAIKTVSDNNWRNLSGNLLILRLSGDEASDALGASHGLGVFLRRLLQTGRLVRIWMKARHLLNRSLHQFDGSGKAAKIKHACWQLGVCLYLFISAIALLDVYIVNTEPLYRLAVFAFVSLGLVLFWSIPVFIVSIAVLSILGLVGIIVTVCFSVVSAPFGVDCALSVLFADITSEAAPPGGWKVTTLERGEADTFERLRHAAVYDCPEAFSTIADWIGISHFQGISHRHTDT